MTHSDPVGPYNLVGHTEKGWQDHLWQDTQQFLEWRIRRPGVIWKESLITVQILGYF